MTTAPTQDRDPPQRWSRGAKYICPQAQYDEQTEYKHMNKALRAPASSPFPTGYIATPQAPQVYGPDVAFNARPAYLVPSFGHPHVPGYPVILQQQSQVSALPYQYVPPAMASYLPGSQAAPGILAIGPDYSGAGVPLGRSSLLPTGTINGHHHQPTRRGLPQKPQRGFTCWVGNIPPGVNIEALKDHFSRDAKEDIMSVFLIRKSNCAFINYISQETCNSAVARFNQVPLGRNGPRLLCRPKRSESGEDSAAQRKDSRTMSVPDVKQDIAPLEITDDTSEIKAQAKYFILKSLTEQDLIDSYRSGVWITQPHVQEELHKAYHTAETVYLVFSVNKSREYFGYAKMKSSPLDDTNVSKSSSGPLEGVRYEPTPETKHAPAGTVVNDPARQTEYWEADRKVGTVTEDASKTRDIPHPFEIEWYKITRKVPFQDVRGLRNSLNGGKEVKVARDGTPLEGDIAKKVIELFQH